MSAFLGLYLLLIGLLMAIGVHRVWLAWGAARARRAGPAPPAEDRWPQHPRVLVQLPIFNEGEGVAELLESAARLEHPGDRLEIQVLDDSDDGSAPATAALVHGWRRRGVNMLHLHRSDRIGFKAGALAAGLSCCTADVIAPFDADFRIPPDFLVRTLPHLTDPEIAMVQARWAFQNPRRNLLTRIQALLLDGHFGVDHRARAAAGRFFNFNGTAGVWRRSAIDDAGGWCADTITEDLDLSIRAWLRGWRFRYLDDVRVPSLLPETVRAFKIQQNRWVAGSLQTARKMLGPVWRSRLPATQKLDLTVILAGNVAYLLLLLLALAVPLAVLLRLDGSAPLLLWADVPFFITATGSVVLSYAVARGPRSWPRYLALIPCLMALGLGMSLHNTRAVLRGLLGRARVFERTPKGGLERGLRRPRRDPVLWLEPAMAIYMGLPTVFGLAIGGLPSVPLSAPFLGLFVGGYLGVAVGGMRRGKGGR